MQLTRPSAVRAQAIERRNKRISHAIDASVYIVGVAALMFTVYMLLVELTV